MEFIYICKISCFLDILEAELYRCSLGHRQKPTMCQIYKNITDYRDGTSETGVKSKNYEKSMTLINFLKKFVY